MTTQIKIMQESIAFITYIHKACVKTWHEFLNFRDVDVAHRVACRA